MKARLGKLDDAINPIVLKELRQAVNGRFLSAVLLLFLLVALATLAIALMAADTARGGSNAGAEVMNVLNMILVGTCLLFLPAYAGFRFASERGDNQTDLMFITTLPARAIVAGKLLATLLLGGLIYAACLPFLTLTWLLRGVDLPTIFIVLAFGFLIVSAAVMLAMLAANLSTARGFRVLMALLVAGALFNGFFGLGAAGWEMTRSGIGSQIDTPEFWAAAGTILLAFGCGMALLYQHTVALISPPGANRALPVRITLLLIWTASVAAMLAWTAFSGFGGMVQVWLYGAGIGWAVVLALAGCERDQWGPRVARTIPAHTVGRAAACLLYSGSVGGMLFAWLMLLCSVGLAILLAAILNEPSGWTWYAPYTGSNPFAKVDLGDAPKHVIALGLYAHGYTLLSVLLQRSVLRRWIPREHTWALTLGLIALGCTLPPLVVFLIEQGDLRYNEQAWMLPAPYSVFFDTFRTGPLVDRALIFAGSFAAVTSLLAWPWGLGVLRRFRPAEVPDAQPLATLEERFGEEARTVGRVWGYLGILLALVSTFLTLAPLSATGSPITWRWIGGACLLIAAIMWIVAWGMRRRRTWGWYGAWTLTLPLWPLFPVGTLLAPLLLHRLHRARPLFQTHPGTAPAAGTGPRPASDPRSAVPGDASAVESRTES